MKTEVEVKFDIGDTVLIKNPRAGYWGPKGPVKATIRGYVIHKQYQPRTNSITTKVYYTVDINSEDWHERQCADAYSHKKRYSAKDLEKI